MTDIPRDEQIARAVREACAKVCEEFDDRPTLSVAIPRRPVDWLILAASAIRSLPISDLVAALPKEEPVAWMGKSGRVISAQLKKDCMSIEGERDFIPACSEPGMTAARKAAETYTIPLYAAPVAQPDAEEVRDGIKAVLNTAMFALNNIDKYCREPHQILRETKALRELIVSLLAKLGGSRE